MPLFCRSTFPLLVLFVDRLVFPLVRAGVRAQHTAPVWIGRPVRFLSADFYIAPSLTVLKTRHSVVFLFDTLVDILARTLAGVTKTGKQARLHTTRAPGY